MFARLGGWCFRRRRTVVALWILITIAGGVLLGVMGTRSETSFELPNVESKRGTDILNKQFGGKGGGDTGTIVFKASQGINDPTVRAKMETLFTKVDGLKRTTVVSPYSAAGSEQVSKRGSSADHIAYASVEVPSNITSEEATKLSDNVKKDLPHIPGVQIELGGDIFSEFGAPSSELLGVSFAIIILIFAFGSVLAMGLPIGVALSGIGFGTILGGLVSHLIALPDFAMTLGVMIGLGVGIDYALFIVTRFRENVHLGHTIEESTVIALDTAGRAVCFAGTTVVISLLGMIIMNLNFITGLAIGATLVVAVTMAASLTLLPALLGFAGTRIEVTRWRGLLVAVFAAIALFGAGIKFPILSGVAALLAVLSLLASFVYKPLRKEVPRRAHRELHQTLAYRWSRLIQAHPWRAFLTGAIALLVLATPVLSLRLGFSDASNSPKDSGTRKAYELLVDGFGPGFNGPLILVSKLPNGTNVTALQPITRALQKTPGVAFASDANLNNPENPTAVQWTVIPTSSPQDQATTTLVNHLRNTILPQVTNGTDLHVLVTGTVAIQVDFSNYLAARLPIFLTAVLALSFLLLLFAFRSLVVPLKAVIMNLLSIGAAYGILVAGFQWGWAGPILNIGGAPIEPFIPMMLFAIVFGLSMDYEVFLLSRIKESWDRTGDSHTSVADGLAATARVITAAAVIMVFVFGSFLFDINRIIKLFGAGLSVAVLLDATIVRMLLVPATMELLGDRNWWLPKFLERILPHLEVEGHVEPLAEPEKIPEPV